MNVLTDSLEKLRKADRCSYSENGPWSAEPTALACLALVSHGENSAALRLAQQLIDVQQPNGAVSATGDPDSPAWPTSLAILAWLACDDFADSIDRALDWSLSAQGRTMKQSRQIGHDTTIVGWSWAAETHAWLEPTAMFVIALKAAGLANHPRCRDGVRLLVDRLLPGGGSNFGSTFVLGQQTLPQVQSTGLAMLALASENHTDPRVENSLYYLETHLSATTTTSSLSYGLLGLTAYSRRPALAQQWTAAALSREFARGVSAYKLALLALAGMTDSSWLPRRAEVTPA